jgi:hypothetical protein
VSDNLRPNQFELEHGLDAPSVIEWLRERYDNCVRIAAQKNGDDQIGWLVDAAYFRAAIEIIDAKEGGKP